MRRKGFTLIELLAVIVILAIIALIATPIILGIISDARQKANESSVELYASAIRNGMAAYHLKEMKDVQAGTYTSSTLPFDIEYEGNVECTKIDIYEDGEVYIEGCTVNGTPTNYKYGRRQVAKPVSFAEDDWTTIIENVKAGNLSKYNVGDTKKIFLTGFTNITLSGDVSYRIRIANTSTPSECSNEGYSQTACGFVIEFEDIITRYNMNSTQTIEGGYPASEMYTYLQNDIYNALPEELKSNIIPTTVVTGTGGSNVITTDKVYLLSGKEVFGSDSDDNAASKTRQLDYYNNIGVTGHNYLVQKFIINSANEWWLRSCNSFYNNFQYVDAHGGLNMGRPTYTYGVSVAFRIG